MRGQDRDGRQGEEETVSSTYRQLTPHRDKYKEDVCLCVCVHVSVLMIYHVNLSKGLSLC